MGHQQSGVFSSFLFKSFMYMKNNKGGAEM